MRISRTASGDRRRTSSSFMFRDLVPIIAERYRVIAPDHLGFGLSDAPSVDGFGYSFESLSSLTAGLLIAGHVEPGELGVVK